MAGVEAIVDHVNGAIVQTNEAVSALNNGKEAMDRAKAQLQEAMGELTPHHLTEYMGILNNALAATDRALIFLQAGPESGEAYIAQLYS